ncbi:Helix-turn-helix domain protein [Pelotomaculum sp. FP]|uniref:helix-turn-helix domain-containing protein n=1 Tax=Pelotomaculum sp. FP TaxID=261474 RepID=UPI00110395E4|nr:helix-turn-helix transcriptional regulator [Pelotomaculum sp. FP]TEB14616.1 Helix-turn-helix domain protein [Pelotomaculum sp. FP]
MVLRLKKIREERGLSLVKLCQMTGIDPGNLSRIERGYIFPYSGWRKRLAEAFKMPEEELFQEVQN